MFTYLVLTGVSPPKPVMGQSIARCLPLKPCGYCQVFLLKTLWLLPGLSPWNPMVIARCFSLKPCGYCQKLCLSFTFTIHCHLVPVLSKHRVACIRSRTANQTVTSGLMTSVPPWYDLLRLTALIALTKTVTADWAFKINYLSIWVLNVKYPSVFVDTGRSWTPFIF